VRKPNEKPHFDCNCYQQYAIRAGENPTNAVNKTSQFEDRNPYRKAAAKKDSPKFGAM